MVKIGLMKREVAFKKLAGLYSSSGWKKYFVYLRFWYAPLWEVEELVPKKGLILDLGCGEGFFSNLLALMSSKRKILGIEIDEKRLSASKRHIGGVELKRGDVLEIKFPKADGIVLFHLLHHLKSPEDQERLIEKCAGALKKGGKLIIVEVDVKLSMEYLAAWITDHFLVPMVFEKRLCGKVFFRKEEEWKKLFRKNGLSGKVCKIERWMMFPHVIFECERLYGKDN